MSNHQYRTVPTKGEKANEENHQKARGELSQDSGSKIITKTQKQDE